MNALQPLINNTDPFNLFMGNSKLVQGFNHNLSVYFHNYRTIKGRYLNGSFNSNLPRMAFVTSTGVDSIGRRITTTVNSNGNYSMNANLGYHIRLKKIPLSVGWELDADKNRNISFTNDIRVTTESFSVTGNMELGIYTDIFSLSLSYSLNRNESRSDLNGTNSANYWIQTPEYDLEIMLPGKFTIYHSGEFTMRPESEVFNQNRNVYYLRGGLGKYFGKKQNIELTFFINDILKQNVGFNRNITTNLVSEELYSQLTRYWLVGFVWNFASAGVKKDE